MQQNGCYYLIWFFELNIILRCKNVLVHTFPDIIFSSFHFHSVLDLSFFFCQYSLLNVRRKELPRGLIIFRFFSLDNNSCSQLYRTLQKVVRLWVRFCSNFGLIPSLFLVRSFKISQRKSKHIVYALGCYNDVNR